MSVFGAYSRYYNLLYKDKDYSGEAAYIGGLITAHCPEARSTGREPGFYTWGVCFEVQG